MKTRTLPALLLTLLLCSLGSTLAQSAPAVTFRTLCTGYAAGVKSVYLKTQAPGAKGKEAAALEVPLYTDVHSLPQELPAVKPGERLVFTRDAAAAGTAPDSSGMAVTLPTAGSPMILFLFIPAPAPASGTADPGAPYRVIALEDDWQSFPANRVKLLNLGAAELKIELGEFAGATAATLAPGKTLLMGPVRKVNHLNGYDAQLAARQKDGAFQPIYRSRWRAVAAKRDLALILPGPGGKPLVRLFEDALPAEIPGTPAASPGSGQ